jgi:hypothetical protein
MMIPIESITQLKEEDYQQHPIDSTSLLELEHAGTLGCNVPPPYLCSLIWRIVVRQRFLRY